jgi:hypothetical protein
MESFSMHKKLGMPQASQLTVKMNNGIAMKTTSGPKSQKRKWDKNPPKDKGTPAEKIPWDVTKV